MLATYLPNLAHRTEEKRGKKSLSKKSVTSRKFFPLENEEIRKTKKRKIEGKRKNSERERERKKERTKERRRKRERKRKRESNIFSRVPRDHN